MNDKEKTDKVIEDIPEEIQLIFDKMKLPQHRRATEEFFKATAEDLNRAYRGPETEKKP